MPLELADSEVTLSKWRPWRIAVVAIPAAWLVALGWLASIAFSGPGGVTGKYHFSIWSWERDHIPTVMLSLFGFGPHPTDAQAMPAIERYFALTTQLRTLQEAQPVDEVALARVEQQRAKDAVTVQNWLERVVTEAYGQTGVGNSLPLFSDVRFLWPPLRTDLTLPMNVLIRSPRNRIDRLGDVTLAPDLTTAQAEAIENANDSSSTVSLVVPIGGVATYPSMDRNDRQYYSVLFTAAHEWVHQYLAFYPLGLAWNTTSDAVVLNETAADMVAPYIADLVQKNHPVNLPAGADGSVPQPKTTIDFNKEMHDLRVQVDALLAQSKVSEAEQLMEAKRQYFVANGFPIRKLNQAYFAFYGTYADYAQSTNPLGNDLQALWKRTANPAAFLAVVRGITSRQQLEDYLNAHQ